MGFTTAAYVVAAVLFILSLGGLSGQESAKRAVWYGIAGMALAVIATLIGQQASGTFFTVLTVILVAAGGVLGATAAKRVQMTEMPQLVAAMHSLVGLAAVFIGFNADLEAARVMALDETAKAALTGFAAILAHKDGVEFSILRVETFLGVFIGAVTFTGSVIAYGKLAGKVDGKAKKLPWRAPVERRGRDHLGAAAGGLCPVGLHPGALGHDLGRALHRLSPDHGDRRGGYARVFPC